MLGLKKTSSAKTLKEFHKWLEAEEKFRSEAPSNIEKLRNELEILEGRYLAPFIGGDEFINSMKSEVQGLLIDIDSLVPTLDVSIFAYCANALANSKEKSELLKSFPNNEKEIEVAYAMTFEKVRWNQSTRNFNNIEPLEHLYKLLGKEKDFKTINELQEAMAQIKDKLQESQFKKEGADRQKKIEANRRDSESVSFPFAL